MLDGKMYQGSTGPHRIEGVRSEGQPAQVSQDYRRICQGSPSEVVVEIHSNPLVSEPGQPSEVASRAASRVEHDRSRCQQRGERGERTGDCGRAEISEGVGVVRVGGHTLGHNVGARGTGNQTTSVATFHAGSI